MLDDAQKRSGQMEEHEIGMMSLRLDKPPKSPPLPFLCTI